MLKNHRKDIGFTLVELLLVTPMVLLIIASFVVVIVSLTGDALANREQLVQARDTQDALDRIEQDIRLSNRFLAESRIPITSPQGLNNDATKFSNVSSTDGQALILQSFATDDNPLINTRNLVFLSNSPNQCSDPLVTSNSPSYTNIVYFVKNSTLYRRVIMPYNPIPAPCSTPWQRTTCAAGQVNGTSCKTEDAILANNVSALSIDYYTTPSSTTPISDASSVSLTPAVRDAALVSASSLRASITLTDTASGRDISYSGASRVSKLNNSTLEVPSVPNVTNFASGPNSITFSWDGIANASSYIVSYSINGGGYITVPNGVVYPSYTVTASRKDTISIKVAANNATGTSTDGTSTAIVPDWTDCGLQNGWGNYGGSHATAQFTKTTANIVVLKGLVKTGAAGTVVCTLPVGYRPDKRLMFQALSDSATTTRVDIDSNGDVIANSGYTNWVNLSTIQFVASGAYTWTDLTPLNSWTHYPVSSGDVRFSNVKVTKDSLGRAHVEGLGGKGTYTSGINIFTLPSGYAPSATDIYGYNSETFNELQLSSTGYVQARGKNGAPYNGIQAIFYPSAITGWTAPSLQNGWVNNGGVFSGAGYKKSTDGIVSLRGLIKGGTAANNTPLFTLPVGSRPAQIIICDTSSADAMARVDIYPNGVVYTVSGVANTWLSLAGCDFMADQ